MDTEYVCVHRPSCYHSPDISIPKGQEEWVLVGESGGEVKESHHKDCISGLHYVSRDSKRVSPYFVNENGTFAWLLGHQGQSVDYATKWGGYRFETVGRHPGEPPPIGSPSKYEYIQEHGEESYFIEDVTGEYRGTPPTANGAALDTWKQDLATFKVKRMRQGKN
jgi:hypothetical protein